MGLSNDLITQFVKLTKDEPKNQNGTTVYGTVVDDGGKKHVKIDGSEVLTPVKTTTNLKGGDRVSVLIKDHTAMVTGNISNPSATNGDVNDAINQIEEFEILIGNTIEAQDAKIGRIEADNVEIKDTLTAVNAEIENLVVDNVEVKEKLTANEAEIEDLKVKKLDAETADLTFATIEELKATNIEVNNIEGNFAEFSQLTTEQLNAIDADIKNLDAEKLSATDADLKYANIDFANINMAAIEHLFAESGIIKDLTTENGTITGELVGVTIKGDLIEANTLVADKLVIKGTDGLYYKLNTDGMTVESEQTDYNSLNGSVITAKSITASKITVSDLVAFGATIGGFKITDSAIYSGVKESVNNTTRGVYLDKNGQIAFGDGTNFVKYFQDSDGKWKISITANNIKLATSNKDLGDAITDIENKIENTVKSVMTYYAISTSPSVPPTTGWSVTPPTWVDGKYIWSKNITTMTDGTINETEPVCITGAKGPSGGTGADGKGVKSIVEQYYLSTSSTSQTGGSWSDTVPTWVNGKYMWTRSVITYTDSTTTITNPVCVTGAKGSDGEVGATGNGVKNIVNYYLATPLSSGVTTSTPGWTTTPQPLTTTNKHLWNYEEITYTDGTKVLTVPAMIGVYGDKGQNGSSGSDGNGIKTIAEKYAVSNSNTVAPMTWYDTVQVMTSTNKYLWNYEIITYTNGTSTNTAKRVIGVYGDKGDTGVGITSVDVEYYLSTSNTSQTGGSWTTTSPAWVDGKYIWSRTKTTSTTGQISYSQPACITGGKGPSGSNGANGATGQGVASITSEYYLSTSKTTPTGGAWVTNPPTWTTGKYMWTRSKIIYKNPTETAYTTPIVDSSWEAVNEIEIGARNFLLNSDFYNNLSGWSHSGSGGTITISEPDNDKNKRFCRISRSSYSGTNRAYVYRNVDSLTVSEGDTVTISADVRSTNLESVSSITEIMLRVPGATDYCRATINTNGKWIRISATSIMDERVTTPTIPKFYALLSGNGTIEVTNIKVEKGNKATDWSPAPEDIDAKIDDIEIGGTNLLPDTGGGFNSEDWQGSTNKTKGQSDPFGYNNAILLTPIANTLDNYFRARYDAQIIKKKGYHTFSVWLKANKSAKINIHLNGSGGRKACDLTTSWQRFWITLDITSIAATNQVVIGGFSTWTDTSLIVTMAYPKVEIGNKPTDWSPAPEDAEKKFATKAELSVTEESILGDVGKTLEGYVENSTFEQKSNEIVATFKSTGGLNLLRNSSGYNGTVLWQNPSGGTMGVANNDNIGGATSKYMYLDNGTKTGESYSYSSRFKLIPGKKYTMSGWFHNYTKCPSFDVWILVHNTLTEDSTSTSYTTAINLVDKATTHGSWKKFTVPFTVPAGTKSGLLRIDANGYDATGTGGANRVHWSAVMINEGEESPWTPHPSETYDGSTTIDATGVTIRNGALTLENSRGDVLLKGDKDGNLLINGGTIVIENMRGLVRDTVRFIGGSTGPGIVFETIYPDSGNQYNVASISLNNNDIGILDIAANSLRIIGEKGNGNLSIGNIHATGTINAGNLQVGGQNVYHTGRKPNLQDLNRTLNVGSEISWGVTGDFAKIYAEQNNTNNNTNLVLEVGDDGNADRVVIRNRHWSDGPYDIAAFKRYVADVYGHIYTQSYRFNSGSPSIMNGRSGDGGFDFWSKENGQRFTFDGTNMKIYKVVNGTWTVIAG